MFKIILLEWVNRSSAIADFAWPRNAMMNFLLYGHCVEMLSKISLLDLFYPYDPF